MPEQWSRSENRCDKTTVFKADYKVVPRNFVKIILFGPVKSTDDGEDSMKPHILNTLNQSSDMLTKFLFNADNTTNIENGARLLIGTLRRRSSIYFNDGNVFQSPIFK
jgi:hypothetical protein